MNEIDILAINDLDKSCTIYEVKHQVKNISLQKVQEKANAFMQNLSNYTQKVLKNHPLEVDGLESCQFQRERLVCGLVFFYVYG